MKLEDQVCSLEMAKRLKELGVKQDGCYSWFETQGGMVVRDTNDRIGGICLGSAFTVAELGEMLPDHIKIEEVTGTATFCFKSEKQDAGEWCASYDFVDTSCCYFMATTEADARAKCLIYLIKNKLVKP